MKIVLGASCFAAFLLERALALVAVAEATHPSPRDDALRSDTTVRFMRRKHREPSQEQVVASVSNGAKAKKNPIDAIGKAAERADDAVANGRMPRISMPSAPDVQNPIEAIGGAAEDADEAAVDSATDTAGESSSQEESQEREGGDDEVPEDKEVPSVPGCRNSPKGWTDTKGQDCDDYAQGEWCTRLGGYGDGWLDEWPKFEELATNGKAATRVCCVCGGGLRAPSEDSGMSGGAPGPAAYAAAAPSPAITRPAKGLQEQGFMGELVEHEDESTMTEDWGKEFGPAAGHRDYAQICRDHKDNEWCLMHGYYDKNMKSSSSSLSMCAVIAVAFFLWLR